MPGRFSVPPRRWRSCLPLNSAGQARPLRTISAPTPLGPCSLCAETDHRSAPLASKRAAVLPTSWVASTCSRLPAAWASAASSAVGISTPVSLLAPITLTSATSSRISARAASRSSAPWASTGIRSTGVALRSSGAAASASRPACSTALSTRRVRPLCAAQRQRAQHRHVVGLGGAAGEHQLGALAAEEGGDARARIGERTPRGLAGAWVDEGLAQSFCRLSSISSTTSGAGRVVALWSR